MTKIVIAPREIIGEPDLNAMIQAFFSRSHESMETRYAELEALGAGESGESRAERIRAGLRKWYINYGHQSIGDCGHITMSLEGVSFLTAKAVQDTPLYSGQETSTRFIDFTNQSEPEWANASYLCWMNIYRDAVPQMQAKILAEYPEIGAGIGPKTFDVTRGLLPITAPTQLSWHGSIRTLREHLAELLVHPITIVRHDAEEALIALRSRWPDLFTQMPDAVGVDWFWEPDADPIYNQLIAGDQESAVLVSDNSNWSLIDPRDPRHLRSYGIVNTYNFIDYAGYRDIQRHRRSYVKSENPLTANAEISDWYLEQLPAEIADRAHDLMGSSDLRCPPLGIEVGTMFCADPEQYRYVTNMRTSPAVHPTARQWATETGEALLARYPAMSALGLEINRELTDYDRRAKATISRTS